MKSVKGVCGGIGGEGAAPKIAASSPLLHVPEGFTIQQVAAPPQTEFPMFGALDNQRRLYLTESSGNDLYAELAQQVRRCRIRVLEDSDGDGRYETAKVFAENLTHFGAIPAGRDLPGYLQSLK